MKKLLGIVVLGLLWCNVGFAYCIGDCTNGYGTYASSDYEKYVGEWKDGLRHGQGTYTFCWDKSHSLCSENNTNGDKYVGEWKDDKKDGLGNYICGSNISDIGILDCKPRRIIKGIWVNNELTDVIKINF